MVKDPHYFPDFGQIDTGQREHHIGFLGFFFTDKSPIMKRTRENEFEAWGK